MRKEFLLASYPRSGSTWFRSIVTCLETELVEDGPPSIDAVNKYFPGIDGDEGILTCLPRPRWFKTHERRHGTNVIFLHRHIGDVLTSEWWYKRKFHDDQRSFEDYVEATGYGAEWRDFTDFYFPAMWNISYDVIGAKSTWASLYYGKKYPMPYIEDALARCAFHNLREVEKEGFGIYPAGNPDIKFFREGKSAQWLSWEEHMRKKLIEKNQKHLKMLGYL